MENDKFKGYLIFDKIKETDFYESYRVIKPSADPYHEQIYFFDSQLSSSAKFCSLFSEHLGKIQENPDLQGILKIREFGKETKKFYIIKDYARSKSLRDIIKESNEQYFPIALEHTVYMIRQLTAFFHYITANVDKGKVLYCPDPEDVKVTFEGEVFLDNVYLADSITKTFGKGLKIFGQSVSYLAPEYVQKNEFNEKSIIFSIGSIFYEILSNKRLMPQDPEEYISYIESFRYPEEKDFEEQIDQWLLDILTKMIQIDPNDRYSSFEELQKDLDDYMEEGNFSPTTFHFVFFLETLFRDYVEKTPKILEAEIEKAKLLEMEAIRESEEEMLHQKVLDTKKESKFPILPVVIVIAFIALIIVALSMHRSWKDEAEALLQEQREARERDEYTEVVTGPETEPKEEATIPVPETALPEEAAPQETPVTPPPIPREEPEPDVRDDEAQRRLEQERLDRQRLERERQEQERIARELQEQEQREIEQKTQEDLQRQEQVNNLVRIAQAALAEESVDGTRNAIADILKIDPDSKEADELTLEADLLERRLRRREQEALQTEIINIAQADTEPTLITSPRIDLRQVEGRIPRDVLRDLKNRVNRITVKMVISENGDVESVDEIIVQRAVYGTFERTGLLAEIEKQVKTAKYTPAIKDGVKRKCYVTLSFPWN